jgi:hypothetical protein
MGENLTGIRAAPCLEKIPIHESLSTQIDMANFYWRCGHAARRGVFGTHSSSADR